MYVHPRCQHNIYAIFQNLITYCLADGFYQPCVPRAGEQRTYGKSCGIIILLAIWTRHNNSTGRTIGKSGGRNTQPGNYLSKSGNTGIHHTRSLIQLLISSKKIIVTPHQKIYFFFQSHGIYNLINIIDSQSQ